MMVHSTITQHDSFWEDMKGECRCKEMALKAAKISTGTIFICAGVTSAEKSTAYPLEFLAAVPTVVHEIASSDSP